MHVSLLLAGNTGFEQCHAAAANHTEDVNQGESVVDILKIGVR